MSVPPVKLAFPQQNPLAPAIASGLQAHLGNPLIQALFAQIPQPADVKAAEALQATHLTSQGSAPAAAAGAGAGALADANGEHDRAEIERLAKLPSVDFRKQLKRAKQGSNQKAKALIEAARKLREEQMSAGKAKTEAVAPPQLQQDKKVNAAVAATMQPTREEIEKRRVETRRRVFEDLKKLQNLLNPEEHPDVVEANAAGIMANLSNDLKTRGGETANFVIQAFQTVEELQYQQATSILMQTLPTVHHQFPRWLIWCYAVDQRMQKVLPNDAGKWWKYLPQWKAIVDMQRNLFLDTQISSYDKCYSKAQCQRILERSQREIQLLKEKALAKKGSEAEDLCLLLDHFSYVLIAPPLPASAHRREVSLCYQHLREVVIFFDLFTQVINRSIKKLSVFFPKDFKEIDYKKFFHEFHLYFDYVVQAIYAINEQMQGKTHLGTREIILRTNEIISIEGKPHISCTNKDGAVQITDAATAQIAVAALKGELFRIPLGIFQTVVDDLWTPAQKDELAKNTRFVDCAIEKDFILPTFRIQDLEFAKTNLPNSLKNRLLNYFNTVSNIYSTEYLRLNAKGVADVEKMAVYKIIPLIKPFFAHFVVSFCYESTLKNLDSHLFSLTKARVQILMIFRDFFQSLDEATLREHGQALLEALKKAHIVLAQPLYNRFQLLFGLAKLGQDYRFDLTEESFVGNDQEPTLTQPLADYLALAGLEQILDKVMKAKRKPAVTPAAPAELRMADLPPAVSQQAPKPAPREEPAPPRVAKVKKRYAPVKAAPAAAPVKKEEAQTEELAQFRTNANERRKVLAMLLEAGFEIQREGGRHTILAHPQGGQFPLPRHATLSTGVTHQAAQAAEAAAGAGAGKKS